MYISLQLSLLSMRKHYKGVTNINKGHGLHECFGLNLPGATIPKSEQAKLWELSYQQGLF